MTGEYTGTVIHKEIVKPLIGVMRFELDGEMAFLPGQFANIYIRVDDKPITRPFSMANPPNGKELEFYLKGYPDGKMVNHLLNLEEGESAVIKGPYGGFNLQDSEREIYFICAGSGVAPVMGMARHLHERGSDRKRTFLQGASYIEELGYREELEEMAGDENFTYIPTISRPGENPDWKGEAGRVEEHLDLCENTEAEVYIAGPPPMVQNVVKELAEKGFSKELIFTERYY